MHINSVRYIHIIIIFFLALTLYVSSTSSAIAAGVTVDSSTDKRIIKPRDNTSAISTDKKVIIKNKNTTTPQQAPKGGLTSTRLKILEFSKEFEKLSTAINVTGQQYLNLRWETNQANAVKGRWEVKSKSNNNQVVASGYTSSAPAPGKFAQFSLPEATFLQANPPSQNVIFTITVRPVDASNQPVGNGSTAVQVTQLSSGNIPAMTKFNDGAVFPSVEIISFKEKIGMVKNTQIYYAGADVKLRISNKGKKKTDSVRVKIKDFNVLLRHNSPGVVVSRLNPGKSKVINIHLDAVLPAPKSQTPQAAQHRQWRRWYKAKCGADLRALMDWHGSQNKMPFNAHKEILLAFEGWGDYATSSPSQRICANGQCVKMCDIEKDIRKQLDGHAVGYAFFAGRYPKFGAGGLARTKANGTEIPFTSKTKITVASVAKMVTAIAAIRILAQNNVSLDAPVGPYFPADWNVGNFFQSVTFSQFLSQTSGIKDYGNVAMTYAQLKTFFEQTVPNNVTTTCQPSSVVNPPNPVNMNNPNFCYSNYNTGIMRILLPRVANMTVDNNLATRPQTLADQYEQLVQQNVFDLVGQNSVRCAPPSSNNHAYAYNFPGDKAGYSWGNVDLSCGAAGWYLSVEDLAKVLLSINARDGKIFTETSGNSQFNAMRTRNFGLDINSATQMEKNGGWSQGCDSNGANCGSITTSASIFGPVTGPNIIGILFINSDISGGTSNGLGARQVMTNAYNNALKPQ